MKSPPTTKACKVSDVVVKPVLAVRVKALRINISQANEVAFVQAVAASQAEIWLADNQGALESSSHFVEMRGLPLAKFRHF